MGIGLFLVRSIVPFTRPTFKDDERLRTEYPKRLYPQPAEIPDSLRALCDSAVRQHNGHHVYTLKPKQNPSDWHVLYIHGGGYVNPLRTVHWNMIWQIVNRTGATVTIPIYPLAPEQDHRPAFTLLRSVLDGIIEQNPHERVAVMGDSAGGNFVLNITNDRHRRGKTLPDQLILFSPWLDLTLGSLGGSEEGSAIEASDPILGQVAIRRAGKWWAGDLDPASPELSPLNGEIAHLPPTAIFQGDRDILVIGCRTFGKRLRDVGQQHEYHETAGGFHVFMAIGWLPETQAVFTRVAELLSRR